MIAAFSYYTIFVILLGVSYFFMLLSWFVSWKLNGVISKHAYRKPITRVTIILPVRNEELHVMSCLAKLTAQNYPAELLQIIVSDDESSDQTAMLCSEFILSAASENASLVLLQANEKYGKGKKAAIENAIQEASGELIITTDADCEMGPDWVNSFVEIYERKKPGMITGFVRIAPVSSFFSALQAIDFLSLSGSAAMTIIREKPLMCNGANLAFSKSGFLSSGGYHYGRDDASGDDTYLMLKIAGKNHGSVVFNNNPDSIVATEAVKSLSGLISQRVRWASKVKNYKETYIKLTGLFIFLVNFNLIVMAAFAIFGFVTWQGLLLLWSFKFAADLFILYPSCKFASQRNLLFLILPAGIIYPFYAVAGMLLALGNQQYKWKERSYDSSR